MILTNIPSIFVIQYTISCIFFPLYCEMYYKRYHSQ